MICVSIGRGRHRHMIAEFRHLAEIGAKLVELRLDYIAGEVNLKRLISDRPCPVIISCRRDRNGGKWSGNEEKRLLLLRSAIAAGVEYIDLEDDVAGQIPRFGKTKRVISHHDFRKTPDDLAGLHARLCKLDPDVVKIATMANHPGDNLRMLELIRGSKVPTVGICMGDIGIPSRILGGRCGAPFTFATFHEERALAPGQLSFHQMTEVYRYEEINDETDIYGVIADPVAHSLSPLIHNAGFRHHQLNKLYLPFRVPREDLARFFADLGKWNIKGLSVTIPHKETVIEKLSDVDPAVTGIGAANTIVVDGPRLKGYNTDCSAAIESLEEALGGRIRGASPLKGRCVLLLGAGGVGKAIGYGLVQNGAQVVVADGEAERAVALAARLKCRHADWAMRHAVPADILVNCTPIGMHPNVDETPFARHHLRPNTVVFDAVYNPENTLLVKDARGRNCKVVTGVEMFVRQACQQFKLFTGQEGPAELMREVIKRAIGAAKMGD